MGNHQSKENNSSSGRRQASTSSTSQPPPHQSPTHPSQGEHGGALQDRPSGSRRRSSRHDLNIFNIGNRHELDPSSPDSRRETKAEREARKLDKERAQRRIDRERSIREEHVDAGYLVTLGTYTGTEDFSKPIVRRLMIERRLAPFWRGLNEHRDDWKDNQLVAAARALPIPPPEENIVYPSPHSADPSRSQCANMTPNSSDSNIVPQTITIPQLPSSPLNDTPNLSPSHPALLPSPTSPVANNGDSSTTPSVTSKSPLFRGRAKTLAALTPFTRHSSQSEIPLLEKQLPPDPYYNGQPVEAFLYKEPIDCPICFLAYPPFLNSTRCCDQPICSECFVQIKRPDPHPPEHADPDDPNAPPDPAQQQNPEYQLVSEVATCPYCKVPEFGITYEPPPFRRGLVYANNPNTLKSAMSSSSSINSQGVHGHSRRRNTSISADSPNVITTDKIRPDWAKKLADARAQAYRRAAAATALHNAAYVMGMNESSSGRFSLGRRRRTLFGGDSDAAPVHLGQVGALLATADRAQAPGTRPTEGQADLFPGRASSRRSRVDDLEELMMMEAIRQSIQMEEERKRKEDKESAKQAKKEEKQRQKEAKKGARSWRNSLYPQGGNDSSASEVAESSNAAGKGKAIDRSAESSQAFTSIPSLGPSTLASGILSSSAPTTQLSSGDPLSQHPPRPLSMDNSSASSFSDMQHDGRNSSMEYEANDSGVSLENGQTAPGSNVDPMLSFRSLDQVIGDENRPPSARAPESAASASADVLHGADAHDHAHEGRKIADTSVEETGLQNKQEVQTAQ